jgi:hypothetical protein
MLYAVDANAHHLSILCLPPALSYTYAKLLHHLTLVKRLIHTTATGINPITLIITGGAQPITLNIT